MVIIDFHCHLSPRGGAASKLIESMNPAGIDMACVFGNDNVFVADAAKTFPNRFIPFVYFDPRYEEVAVETVEKYAKDYGIQMIPTQVFMDKNGDEVFRHVGFLAKEAIIKALRDKGIL